MPNLAIATALRSGCGSNSGAASRAADCGVELLYVGSRRALDRQLVEAADIPFKSIFAGKLRRYFSWRHFVDPFLVLIGFFQSLWILISFWPHAVFAKGGFVSLPVVFAAFLLRRPILLHESDRVMGLSNKIVAKLSRKVCVAFPDVMTLNKSETRIFETRKNQKSEIRNSKIVFTGNPIRSSVQHGRAEKGYKLTHFHPERPVILVWGGSQGAQEINELIEASFSHLKSIFQLVHITGHNKQIDIQDPSYRSFEYLGDELKHIYAITDLVIGRAGANSLYELALMRKPNILIPLKSAAHNHQQLNAEYFENEGASIVLRDQPLHEVVLALWHNFEKREAMKEALGRLARPDATNKIAGLILSASSKFQAPNSK